MQNSQKPQRILLKPLHHPIITQEEQKTTQKALKPTKVTSKKQVELNIRQAQNCLGDDFYLDEP